MMRRTISACYHRTPAVPATRIRRRQFDPAAIGSWQRRHGGSVIGSASTSTADGYHDGGRLSAPFQGVNQGLASSAQGRSFSSTSTSHAPPSSSLSLQPFKKIIRPFLRACHPDAMTSIAANAEDEEAPGKKKRPTGLSHRAKAVNLKAVQTVNGLVDVLEDLIGRCTPPAYSTDGDRAAKKSAIGAGSLPELKPRYEIEFILPTTVSNNVLGGTEKIKQKHRDKAALTLRSITVSFPEHLRTGVRKWALTSFPSTSSQVHPQEEEAFDVAMQLKNHSMGELVRLLTIAGMQAPAATNNEAEMNPGRRMGNQRKEEGAWTLSDHFLHELGIDPMENSRAEDAQPHKHASASASAFFGRTQSQPLQRPSQRGKAQTTPPPRYSHPTLQSKREKFMSSIPWNKFADDYDRAFDDAKADWTTQRLDLYNVSTTEGRERREQFVSGICGGVRVWRAKLDGNDEDGFNDVDEIPEGLELVPQLIAIRRLSLLLVDNFDHLRMEKMGRMWEQLVIVLTPPRGDDFNNGTRKKRLPTIRDDGSRIVHRPHNKLSKWERKMRRRQMLQPSSRGKMRFLAETQKEKLSEEEQEEEASISHWNESGFKFSYGTQIDQGTGHVTAYIPIDFGDKELVRHLYTHLYDYYDTCCGDMGFLKFGPDGDISANAGFGGGPSTTGASGGDAGKKRMDAEE